MIYNNIQFDVVLYRCYDFQQSIQEHLATWRYGCLWKGKNYVFFSVSTSMFSLFE